MAGSFSIVLSTWEALDMCFTFSPVIGDMSVSHPDGIADTPDSLRSLFEFWLHDFAALSPKNHLFDC